MVVAVIKIFHGLIFFDFFNEKCLNEKITQIFYELKQDLISEIKSLIRLEMEKVVKKQKEEFNLTVLKLEELTTTLEL